MAGAVSVVLMLGLFLSSVDGSQTQPCGFGSPET
jgi:hypothetical protein